MSGKSFYRSIDLANAVTKKLKVHELVKKKDRVLISISGGQDSLCLVFLLNQLSEQMELHLGFFWCHHLWQIDSFSLMNQIAKVSFLFQCGSCFAIPFSFVSSELAARNWRQQSSFRVAVFYNYDKIGLAHSANDKIETLFLNLIRGTGLTGLSPLRWVQASSGKNTQEMVTHRSCLPLFLVSKFYWSSFFTVETFGKHEPGLKTATTQSRMPEWHERLQLLAYTFRIRRLTNSSTLRKNSEPFLFTFSLNNLSKRTFAERKESEHFVCFPFFTVQSINLISSFVLSPNFVFHFALEYANRKQNRKQFYHCLSFLGNLQYIQYRKKRATSFNLERLKHVTIQYSPSSTFYRSRKKKEKARKWFYSISSTFVKSC